MTVGRPKIQNTTIRVTIDYRFLHIRANLGRKEGENAGKARSAHGKREKKRRKRVNHILSPYQKFTTSPSPPFVNRFEGDCNSKKKVDCFSSSSCLESKTDTLSSPVIHDLDNQSGWHHFVPWGCHTF